MKLYKDIGKFHNYSYNKRFENDHYNRYVIDIDIPKENPILQAMFLSEIDYDGSIFNRTMEDYEKLFWEATFYTDTKLRLITTYDSAREFLGGLNSIISYFPNHKVTVYHTLEKEKLEGYYYRLPVAEYISIKDENNGDYIKFMFNFNGNHP